MQTARRLQTHLECTQGIFVFKPCRLEDYSFLTISFLPPPGSFIALDKVKNPQPVLKSSSQIWLLSYKISSLQLLYHSSHAALFAFFGRPSSMLGDFLLGKLFLLSHKLRHHCIPTACCSYKCCIGFSLTPKSNIHDSHQHSLNRNLADRKCGKCSFQNSSP